MSALVSATDFKSDESIAGYALGSSILSSSRHDLLKFVDCPFARIYDFKLNLWALLYVLALSSTKISPPKMIPKMPANTIALGKASPKNSPKISEKMTSR